MSYVVVVVLLLLVTLACSAQRHRALLSHRPDPSAEHLCHPGITLAFSALPRVAFPSPPVEQQSEISSL